MTGLRREEVAVLAGVSADCYVRLEQSRETNPSPQVVDALGRALHVGAGRRLPRPSHPDLLRLLGSGPTPRRAGLPAAPAASLPRSLSSSVSSARRSVRRALRGGAGKAKVGGDDGGRSKQVGYVPAPSDTPAGDSSGHGAAPSAAGEAESDRQRHPRALSRAAWRVRWSRSARLGAFWAASVYSCAAVVRSPSRSWR